MISYASLCPKKIVQLLPATDWFVLCEFFLHMSGVRCEDIKVIVCIVNRNTHGCKATGLCLIGVESSLLQPSRNVVVCLTFLREEKVRN